MKSVKIKSVSQLKGLFNGILSCILSGLLMPGIVLLLSFVVPRFGNCTESASVQQAISTGESTAAKPKVLVIFSSQNSIMVSKDRSAGKTFGHSTGFF